MLGKKFSEWKVLNGVCLLGSMMYVISNLIVSRKIEDWLFVCMLLSATIFLNYRQYRLCRMLLGEEGNKFFGTLYQNKEWKAQIENLFCAKANDIFACAFAVLFAIVMFTFELQVNDVILKIFFAIFLFTANVPTGLAIVRLIRYFYYTKQWIEKIQFDILGTEYFEVDYVKKVRNSVLFTAVFYCSLSLSSILFTHIELNWLVGAYTIFAIILVCVVLLITNAMLGLRKEKAFNEAHHNINRKIAKELERLMECNSIDEFDKIEFYSKIKETMKKQREKKIEIDKILSGIGLVFITVIPIILQWLLELL